MVDKLQFNRFNNNKNVSIICWVEKFPIQRIQPLPFKYVTLTKQRPTKPTNFSPWFIFHLFGLFTLSEFTFSQIHSDIHKRNKEISNRKPRESVIINNVSTIIKHTSNKGIVLFCRLFYQDMKLILSINTTRLFHEKSVKLYAGKYPKF